MRAFRVLVVDGSSLSRQIITRALTRDSSFEVVGTASSGPTALAKSTDLRPDIVVMEIELSDGSSLQSLPALRSSNPSAEIIILSRLVSRGSEAAVEALLLGANGYVTKPDRDTDLDRCVTDLLIPKLKASARITSSAPVDSPLRAAVHDFASVDASTHVPVQTPPLSSRSSVPVLPEATDRGSVRPSLQKAQIVAIATSTGGPSALATVLSGLPASFSVPIVIVQHMPEGFTKALADSLSRQTGHTVREVVSRQPLSAAPIWLAAGGRDLTLDRDNLTVYVAPQAGSPENDCCPSADVMFRSVCQYFGGYSLGVVLTGIGNDGLLGCREIRAAGGSVIAQDEASSIAWGMPGQVTSANLADAVLPLNQIANEIMLRTCSTPRRTNRGNP